MLKIQKLFVDACSGVESTDKVSHHGYHRTYPYFLNSLRDKSVRMLEIGVDKRGSLELWRNYFNDCIYYGVDIRAQSPEEEVHPGYYILQGDQSKLDFLEQLISRIKMVDFVIDDGSHVPDHQILTFNTLFEKILSPGGIYIIEDIETSYWKRHKLYGYDINFGVGHPHSLIERIKSIVDCVNSEFTNGVLYSHPGPISHSCQNLIESITFSHNALIFVKKDPSNFERYYNRAYRSRSCV